ncbi:endonuclease/exonuclease/phosphatase family protein [Aquimarina sp. W85]|uniref:endonuclease/exonuclease/phosphatase family protein n=1 Tax=Aquimarina rhodophyticola TaxID=3342246 RepID=UPI0036735A2E
MRNLIHRFVFLLNSIIAFALLLSYLLPYISPKTFPLLSVLSLTVPILILINALFMVYWMLVVNKRFLLSFLVLLLGISHVFSLYKFRGKTSEADTTSVSLLSYNVHSFNRFDWIDNDSIPQQISALVKQQNPDIFCGQEFYENPHSDFSQYPFSYQDFNNDNGELALVILSKYPIINKGSLQFEGTANNIIFSDIVIKKDTLRIYNVHLQSHRITPSTDAIAKEGSQKLLGRMQASFIKQQQQVDLLTKHIDTSPYKVIVMGDFNNSAYSYVYNTVLGRDLKDAFKEAGKGFGKTFEFKLFPVRIDFILVAENFEVLTFKNFDSKLSDHYPVYTQISLD